MPVWRERPTVEDAGVVGWFRGLLETRPIRPDRSRTLDSERGGRLDRLDLWLLVVLVVATMGLRTFRLAEPYQMHFDEVYHARTATEFLQSWRYGLSHDIYEWTHPHLAKYAMAGGLVLWGQDEVSATSELGTPVTATVVEPRRDDALAGGRAGERLHVATGTEIRTFDLRTRQLIGVMAAPGATALAMSDRARNSSSGSTTGGSGRSMSRRWASAGWRSASHRSSSGPASAHAWTSSSPLDDGVSLMVASGDRLSTVDVASGDVTAGLDLPRSRRPRARRDRLGPGRHAVRDGRSGRRSRPPSRT